VVLALDGAFLRSLGEGVLDRPSSVVFVDGHLVVTELFGALAVFEGDEYIGHIGTSARSHQEPRWPNAIDVARAHRCAAADGALYLTEWFIGGRVIKLS
jgi:hypothetical protein